MTLSELIESVDICEYISQFTELEEKNGEFWGLSPLKDENTPSFSVNPEIGSFYDFSSGKGGNILTFIRCYFNCNKRKAEEILRTYAGKTESVVRQRKMEATKVAKRFAPRQKIRKESKSTILQDDYMERYEKRADKLAAWVDEGISQSSLDKFQVYYDGFSNRIVYPIKNTDGKIINVSGRTVDPAWKEKELRKYTYFKPLGILDTLYGLFENKEEILRKREVIIFEGAKSVMIADTWGIHNTVAILTSHLNPYQLRLLAQLGCRAVFALDKDVSVREDENIQKLKRYIRVEYLWDKNDLLEEKMSPVDNGFETWHELYVNRISWN